jgi:hypothetical protein
MPFFEIAVLSITKFWATYFVFSMVKVTYISINFGKKWDGLHCGRFFSQTHLVALHVCDMKFILVMDLVKGYISGKSNQLSGDMDLSEIFLQTFSLPEKPATGRCYKPETKYTIPIP